MNLEQARKASRSGAIAAFVSWTLTLLLIGVAVGCLNAWYWVKQESERD